jgi:RIP homotypic interaction motif
VASSLETGDSRARRSELFLWLLGSASNDRTGPCKQEIHSLDLGPARQSRRVWALSPVQPKQRDRIYSVDRQDPLSRSRVPDGSRTRPLAGRQAGHPPREAVGGPHRTILIEHSSGIQVGKNNDQVSIYRVTLPRASFASADRLAGALLRQDAPWARDVFTHDGRPDLTRAASGGPGSSSSGIVESPWGDTLVIVRNSRGVQIGNRNFQRNEFQIRVSDTVVRPDRIGTTRERRDCISRLRRDPGDGTAARRLAENLGRAARTELAADLTVRVRQTAGEPKILRRSGEFRRLTGRQIGGPGNHARILVHVTVQKFDTRVLARRLQVAAKRLPRTQPPRLTELGQQRSGRDTRGGRISH